MERKEIEKIIITAFNDYLETQGIEGEVTSDTILFGSDAELDSMGLVNVVIDIESTFQDQGYDIALASDRAMSRKSSPFRTVATLADFILELIEEASG
jgi:acyl carrier protein